jgi:hypothetical protein
VTARAVKLRAEASPHVSFRKRREFINLDSTPSCALTWTNPRDKARQLDRWRNAVGRRFARSARVLHVAWNLEWLFKDGYAFPTDSYLSRKLQVPVNKIQDTLKALEDAGAIYRASVIRQGKALRRIWPSKEIVDGMHPDTGGIDTPHENAKTSPRNGETEYSSRRASPLSSTATAAQRDAARREAREREREDYS